MAKRSQPTAPCLLASYTANTGQQQFTSASRKKKMELPKSRLGSLHSSHRKKYPLIPRHGVSIEEAYSRFTWVMSKAAHSAILGEFVPSTFHAWMIRRKPYWKNTKKSEKSRVKERKSPYLKAHSICWCMCCSMAQDHRI